MELILPPGNMSALASPDTVSSFPKKRDRDPCDLSAFSRQASLLSVTLHDITCQDTAKPVNIIDVIFSSTFYQQTRKSKKATYNGFGPREEPEPFDRFRQKFDIEVIGFLKVPHLSRLFYGRIHGIVFQPVMAPVCTPRDRDIRRYDGGDINFSQG